MNDLTIGKLAHITGVNIQTIRYYEKLGLLDKPARNKSGYRMFPAESQRVINLIKGAQELGFSLKEAKELLMLRVSHKRMCAEVAVKAEQKIVDVEHKITQLKHIRRALINLTTECRTNPSSEECHFLMFLEQTREGRES